jgi:hypothetical protein
MGSPFGLLSDPTMYVDLHDLILSHLDSGALMGSRPAGLASTLPFGNEGCNGGSLSV